MAVRPCPVCGSAVSRDSSFCDRCGSRIALAPRPPTFGRYTPIRFQLDPTEPPPYRDARWLQIVLGIALATVGAILLAAYGLVASLTPSGACPGGCGAGVLDYALLLPGSILLGGGAILGLVGLLRTL